MAAVPSWTTGLLVCEYKVKNGEMPFYRVDTAVMAELRSLLRQAAEEELRQGEDQREDTGEVDIVAQIKA
jgi:hypothetical protein